MYSLYFDPGLGAMIIQSIVAAVAAILLFSKNILYKVKAFFGLTKKDNDELFDDINVKESDIDNTSN
ncbi:hypothetical protein JAO71_11625 [Olleya sp. YSTF-M6]|uniref:Uncharacterized protein n=1 Tax=Olleya sediminilitoris TaxID=2795739 RepID=A0ABS1WMW2_9FLAO|nr:hypothetical protein [Olleya sediminilitoris]MBL7560452.1 hypothetical protein [Olleya sediminilitoris]